MEQDNAKSHDLKEEIGNIIKLREEKWNAFFDRFNGMDEVKSDEELSEIDENDENEAEEIDEDDDESDNESSSCIEVSDDEDENMVDGINDNDFEQAYKEVAQNTIKTFQLVREEHTKEEIKTKDMTKYLSKSVIEKKAVTTTPIMAPSSLSNALVLTNTPHANNDCNGLDLVEKVATPQLIETEITKGGIVYVHQTTTTTTTTTTIIKREESAATDNIDDIDAPTEGTPRKKLKRSDVHDANTIDYGDNDFYTTPQASHRKSKLTTPANASAPRNLLAIANTPHRIVVTPKAAKSPHQLTRSSDLIKKSEIKKQLKEELGDYEISKKDLKKIDRNIRVAEHETVAVLVCPEQVTPEPQDFLSQFRSRKSTLLVKEE